MVDVFDKLRQVCQMMVAASSPSQEVQRRIWQTFTEFNQDPYFNEYLLTVFAHMPNKPAIVRQRAGLLLKTQVTNLQAGRFPADVADDIIAHTMFALKDLKDANRTIRQTAGTILTTVVQKRGFSQSGPVVEQLVDSLGNRAPEVKEGSLSALSKICEDEMVMLGSASPEYADAQNIFVQWSAQRLLPRIFDCTSDGSLDVRKHAVDCLNHYVLNGAFSFGKFPLLEQFSSKYIDALGLLARDTDPGVTKSVCKGFSTMVEHQWTCLTEPHYHAILKYMLQASMNSQYEVRFEALAVWSVCGNSWDGFGVTRLMLPNLVPVLLENMIYTNADYMCMEASQLEDDNAAKADALDEIQPRFAKDNARGGVRDDDDEDDVKEKLTWGINWTARKAAASALDTLSHLYSEDLMTIALPHIQAKLEHSSWEHQEAGVLAIGTIGVSCITALEPYLPKVLELLIGLSSSSKPLVRSISIWCISRFSPWVCHHQAPNQQQVLAAVLKTLLQSCLDRNKKVQEAACSAFAHLEEVALAKLSPFLDDIIRTLVAAFDLYQAKNLRNLYDAIGTLAWAAGPSINQPNYVEALLVPVMHKFETVPDNDITAVSLFECMTCLAQCLGPALLKRGAIPRIVQRCMNIVPTVAQAAKMWEQNPNEFERPDRELMATALDLLAGIIEGLGERTKEVLAQQNFLVVIRDALNDNAPRVRQSGYALMGTCAGKCIEQLGPMLPELLPLCAKGLAQGNLNTVRQNASWAIGEVCVQVGGQYMKTYLDVLVPALAAVLQPRPASGRVTEGYQVLMTNVCITIGRLALVCGEAMAPFLNKFLCIWCTIVRHARPDVEKAKAFKGIAALIKANPHDAVQHVPQFCTAASTLQYLQMQAPQILLEVKEVLHYLKTGLGGHWNTIYDQVDVESKRRLHALYQLE